MEINVSPPQPRIPSLIRRRAHIVQIINTSIDAHCQPLRPQSYTLFIVREVVHFQGASCIIYDIKGRIWNEYRITNQRLTCLTVGIYIIFVRRTRYALRYSSWFSQRDNMRTVYLRP